MNNKGFTLIELLAVILLLALITAVAFPMVGNMLESSKKSSYKILLNNIKSAAGTYFEECRYNNDNNSNKICIDEYNGHETNPTIKLSKLVNYGLLNSTEKECKPNSCVKNPITNNEIGDCQIMIQLSGTKYIITSIPGENCPTQDELDKANK